MKNNKGFTLVELMAVIVVLAIIISIAIPSAIAISNKIKKNMYKTKVEMIENSAKIYGQDNPSSVASSEGDCGTHLVTVQTLIDKGYIKKDESGEVQNPIDNSSLNNKSVCIYKKNNRVYAKAFNTEGNLWQEGVEIDGGSCSTLGAINGNKVCAPVNWETCAKLGSKFSTGANYNHTSITPYNIAIISSQIDTESNDVVIRASESGSNLSFVYVTKTAYESYLSKIEVNFSPGYGGEFYKINFEDCRKGNYMWFEK